MKPKSVVTKNKITRKEFSYEKGNVRLSFNLTLEDKPSIQDFLECLVKAQEDVSEEINKQ